MSRWTTAFPSYSTLYTFVEVTDWTVTETGCTYNIAGGLTSPYYWNVNGLGMTLGWYEGGTYHTLGTDTASYNRNGGDVYVFDMPDTFSRQAADRTVYLYCEGTGGGTAYAESSAYTVPHLAPTVNWAAVNPVVRNSDNSITLTWDAPALTYSAMCLEVSVDGGNFSQFAVLWNTATTYTWNGCSADHSYQFRIRTNYLASYSAYDTCATVITNTPAAPQSITVQAAGGTTVDVTLSNASPVATSIEWQASTDGGSTWTASTTVNGSPVTSFQATGISGTAYIRVRNKNATGTSAWLTSEQITTICPPNPPTLTSPSGNVWNMGDGAIVFAWRHNTLDGSTQSAYELSYAVNGGAATTLTGTTAQTRTLALTGLSVGDSIEWKVRTKGADATYSDWSASNTFNLYTEPTVNITAPAATVTAMPIAFTATYSDMAGFTCTSATVTLSQSGKNLFSEAATIAGTTISASLDSSEFLPTNGGSYTVTCVAQSSSSLQASANTTFTVNFTEPVEGVLNVTNDPDTGYASLLASWDNASDPNAAAAVSISVARVNADGTLTALMSEVATNSGVVDRYAPLNTTYQYAVTTKAASGALKTVYVYNTIVTDLWFAYWGDNVASAKWNPDNGGIQLSRPQKTRVYYAGRKNPVSYDGSAVNLSETPSWMFIDQAEVQPFVQLIEDGGRGVYKSCDGWVYHADFDLTLTPSYTAIGYYGGAGLSITRIAGDRL